MSQLSTELFEEPASQQQRAGLEAWERPKTAYYEYMVEEGIPIVTGIGVHDVRELDLGEWRRLQARGAFLYLDGLEGLKGMYVLEVPGEGATAPERHLFHEFYLVLEGRGTVETWFEGSGGSGKRLLTEWQPGSLLYFPPNVSHRLVNATRDRVLVIAANNAPPLFNIVRDRQFIFDNDYLFRRHYQEDESFYRYDENVYAVPTNKRAQARTNFFPDIINAELPLDNQRLPGYRRIQPAFRGFERDHNGFIAEYPVGRYSRGHHHGAGAVLVCLRGAGYTFNWPRQLGTTPWRDGHGDQVRICHYKQGGLVAAAPGGGNWFHQHFAVSEEPFRVINYWGGPTPIAMESLNPETGKNNNLAIRDGGGSIPYSEEDPYVRRTFESALADVGMRSQMPEELYQND